MSYSVSRTGYVVGYVVPSAPLSTSQTPAWLKPIRKILSLQDKPDENLPPKRLAHSHGSLANTSTQTITQSLRLSQLSALQATGLMGALER